MLDVRERRIIVIGAGNVARRKVAGLVEAGASNITVVAPQIPDDFPHTVSRIISIYHASQIAGASLVFAATNDAAVNDQIVRDAHAAGALVCRADHDDQWGGDFATPAIFRRGEISLAIASGGSPVLSAMIRDKLADAFDPRWPTLASAMQTLRPLIRERFPAPERREIFHRLCSDQAMQQLALGGIEQLKAWLFSTSRAAD